MEKILSKEQLKDEMERLRKEGKKIAFTNGCFDILHVGHTRYLRDARKRGDVLILALNSDASVRAIKGEKRPLVPENERADVVASLESVDYVTIFNELTPLELIEYLRPDVIVKGGDWVEERWLAGSPSGNGAARWLLFQRSKAPPPRILSKRLKKFTGSRNLHFFLYKSIFISV